MSNNIFSWKRFSLLFKQHLIHNAQFLLFSTGAYVGVIFIVLSVAQLSNGLEPFNLEAFQGFLMGFVIVFGVLYAGHSFPAFRSKESTINYLMLPASVLEKFAFEFISRIAVVILALPLLYWITFHMQGYFFAMFSREMFVPIGIHHLVTIELTEEYRVLIYALITSGLLFALSLALTGAAMFTKQPLVKSLFAIAMVVMFFAGYSYVIITYFGIEGYHPPDNMLLVPLTEDNAMKSLCVAFSVGTIVMLFVAFRKLKEREV